MNRSGKSRDEPARQLEIYMADEAKDKGGAGDPPVPPSGSQTPDEPDKELVELGRTFKGLRDKYPDINFDELPGAFTRVTQENAEFHRALETPPAPAEDDPNKIIWDSLKPYWEREAVNIRAQARLEVEQSLALKYELDRLEYEYNGADGKPKFDRNEIMGWIRANGVQQGIYNPEAAYRTRYQAELAAWERKQGQTPPHAPDTGRPSPAGSHLPEGKTPKSMSEASEMATEFLRSKMNE